MLFIDIFVASLCLMSRITMIEARPMPQHLHTFHPANHTSSGITKMSIHQRIQHPHHPPVEHHSKPSILSEADHECHHEREQPGSFSKGETQNGIREQLSPHAWVTSHTGDQGPKDRSDTHTGTSKTDCSETGTDVASRDDQGFSELGGEWTDQLRREGRLEGIADLLTLEGLEGRLGGVVVLDRPAHA